MLQSFNPIMMRDFCTRQIAELALREELHGSEDRLLDCCIRYLDDEITNKAAIAQEILSLASQVKEE